MKKLLLWILNKVAPLGYEDEKGFHYGEQPAPKPARIQQWPWTTCAVRGCQSFTAGGTEYCQGHLGEDFDKWDLIN